jgi:hypothetical protein
MYVFHDPESGTPGTPLRPKSSAPRSGFVQPAGWSEREAAVRLRDKPNVRSGCLPSLTLNVIPKQNIFTKL